MNLKMRMRTAREENGSINRRVRFLCTTLAILSVLVPYTVSYGEMEGNFTLVNVTQHYLHVLINNKSYSYIAPGRTIVHEVSASTQINVEVSYSPGQGIRGNVSRSFQILLQTTSGQSTDCSSSRSTQSRSCNSSINSGSVVLPARWDVTPADFSAGGREE